MINKEDMLRLYEAGEYNTNHVLHLLISLLTAGLWIPVWFLVAQRNASKRASIINKTSLFSRVFMLVISSWIIIITISIYYEF